MIANFMLVLSMFVANFLFGADTDSIKEKLNIENSSELNSQRFTRKRIENYRQENKIVHLAALIDCELSTSDFKGTEFEDVSFQNTQLINNDFSFARFKDVDFQGAQLHNNSFYGATIFDAEFDKFVPLSDEILVNKFFAKTAENYYQKNNLRRRIAQCWHIIFACNGFFDDYLESMRLLDF